VIVQQVRRPDGSGLVNQFNTRGTQAATTEGALAPYASRLLAAPDDPLAEIA
jgi:hypothetical protein